MPLASTTVGLSHSSPLRRTREQIKRQILQVKRPEGLLDIGQPQPNETVVVSGAAGAVGTMVVQIPKR